MNTTSPVQLGRFKEPEVKSGKMTEGHGVPEKVFLQCSLVVVQGVFLLFEVLLDETSPVVVEVFKDKGLFQGGLQG